MTIAIGFTEVVASVAIAIFCYINYGWGYSANDNYLTLIGGYMVVSFPAAIDLMVAGMIITSDEVVRPQVEHGNHRRSEPAATQPSNQLSPEELAQWQQEADIFFAKNEVVIRDEVEGIASVCLGADEDQRYTALNELHHAFSGLLGLPLQSIKPIYFALSCYHQVLKDREESELDRFKRIVHNVKSFFEKKRCSGQSLGIEIFASFLMSKKGVDRCKWLHLCECQDPGFMQEFPKAYVSKLIDFLLRFKAHGASPDTVEVPSCFGGETKGLFQILYLNCYENGTYLETDEGIQERDAIASQLMQGNKFIPQVLNKTRYYRDHRYTKLCFAVLNVHDFIEQDKQLDLPELSVEARDQIKAIKARYKEDQNEAIIEEAYPILCDVYDTPPYYMQSYALHDFYYAMYIRD